LPTMLVGQPLSTLSIKSFPLGRPIRTSLCRCLLAVRSRVAGSDRLHSEGDHGSQYQGDNRNPPGHPTLITRGRSGGGGGCENVEHGCSVPVSLLPSSGARLGRCAGGRAIGRTRCHRSPPARPVGSSRKMRFSHKPLWQPSPGRPYPSWSPSPVGGGALRDLGPGDDGTLPRTLAARDDLPASILQVPGFRGELIVTVGAIHDQRAIGEPQGVGDVVRRDHALERRRAPRAIWG